jgi:hypothetical protein
VAQERPPPLLKIPERAVRRFMGTIFSDVAIDLAVIRRLAE